MIDTALSPFTVALNPLAFVYSIWYSVIVFSAVSSLLLASIEECL